LSSARISGSKLLSKFELSASWKLCELGDGDEVIGVIEGVAVQA
jgi:hypothetical protein